MQIVVLGMHRSGTSTVAGLLSKSGAYFGPEGIAIAANTQNPKGFWERRDLRGFCDGALARLGVEWWSPSKLDLARLTPEDHVELAARARPILDDLEAHRPWFVKEPRLCLLFPLLRPLLEAPVVVHVTREPIEIARSLWQRDAFPISMGLSLWEIHRISALASSVGVPSVTVDYNALMASPFERTRALCEELGGLGVRGLVPPSREVVDEFVDPSLHRARADDGESRAFLTEAQRALRVWSHAEAPPALTAALIETLSTLEEREKALRARQQTITKLEHERTQLLLERQQAEADREALATAQAEAKVARREQRQLEAKQAAMSEDIEKMRIQRQTLKQERKDVTANLRKAKTRMREQERRAEELEARLGSLTKNPIIGALAWVGGKLRRRAGAATDEIDVAPKAKPHTSSVPTASDYHDALAPILADPIHQVVRESHAESEAQIAAWLAEPLAERPLVSIIMPTYDREAIVGDAIRSVLAQSYRELELIVADDGSQDKTLEVVRSFRDSRVQVIEASHGGAARARNLALARARGSLIAYLDSDNIWHPSFLDVMVRQLARHPGRWLGYAKYVDIVITEEGTSIKKARALPFDYESLSDRNYIDLNTVLHRRALVDHLGGFDEDLARQQDWDLLLKYTFLADPLYVDAFLTLYRRNAAWNQISVVQKDNPRPPAQIQEKVAGYYAHGLPFMEREPKGAKSVTVVSWDICRNHFSKAYSVAEILARSRAVQLLGFRFFEEGLFAPFKTEVPSFETTYLEGAQFPELHRTFAASVRSVQGDVVYAVKPRLASLGVALLANYHFGTPFVLEHNDLESVVTSPGAGDSVEALDPAAIDVHDPDLLNPYGQTWSRIMQAFAQRVPVSTTHNHNLDRFFGERSFFVRNPKDEAFFDPARHHRAAIRRELGFAPKDRVILFGGMLRKHKGIHALVELVQRLGPEYKLLFVSSRENKEQEELERTSAGPRVRFLGSQNRNDMARINLAADLVILWLDPDVPASHYQMPYKLTDAMAMNVPVIANDVSDLGELGQRGLLRLCPYGDYDALEKTIEALFADDASRLAMVAAARRLYLRQFSYSALERILPMVLEAAEARRGETLPVSVEFAELFARFYAATKPA